MRLRNPPRTPCSSAVAPPQVAARRRAGVTLLEVIVGMALTSYITFLAVDLWRDARSIYETCVHDRFATREALAWMDRLRADVRAAAGVAAAGGGSTTGPGVLILNRPDGAIVVHRLTEDRVAREIFEGAACTARETWVRTAESLAFTTPGRPGRPDLIRFELRLRRRSERGRMVPVFDGWAGFREVQR